MTKLSISSLLSSAALALALVGNANATTVSVNDGIMVAGEGMETSVAGATTMTFDGLTSLPANFVTIGTPSQVLVSGNSAGNYSAPTGDTSTFLTTGSGVILDMGLSAGVNYFGFYWGSVDAYNDFDIVDSNGNTFNINGAEVAALAGIPDDGSTSVFVDFYADPGATFTSVGFGSVQNSFEFDNLATATPEPASIAMLAGGLLIIGGALRRKKA